MKITPVDGEALCGHCKGMQKATFTELIEKGNRARLSGTCKKCGVTKVNRFIAHADAGKYKGRSGGCDCPYSGSDADKKEIAAADASDFGVAGGARRRKSRKSGSRKSRKSHKSGSRKSRHSRKSGSRKSRHSRKTGSRKSRHSRKSGSRKSRHSRKAK